MLQCTVVERTVLWCTYSGDESAPLQMFFELEEQVEGTVQCCYSVEDSAPLQMEWKVVTLMLFELEELVEETVLCCFTSSHVAETRVPSALVSTLSEFLLLHVSFFSSNVSSFSSNVSSFSSKCQRVQCSAAPHVAQTGVPCTLVSILSEFLLLHSEFYQSSIFSALNLFTVPSSPLSGFLEFLLLQCQFDWSSLCSIVG